MRNTMPTFRSRMFLYLICVSLVPMVICSLLMVQLVRVRLNSGIAEENSLHIQEMATSLDRISEAMNQATIGIQNSPSILQALSGGEHNELAVNAQLYHATESAQSFAVFDLYNAEGQCLYSTGDTGNAPELHPSWGLLHGAASLGGLPFYYASEDPTNSVMPLYYGAAALSSPSNPQAGYLVMRIYVSGFHTLLDGKYSQNDLLVLNSYFRPVYGSNSHLSNTVSPLLRQQLLDGSFGKEEHYVTSAAKHEATGLFIVLRHPISFIVSTIHLLNIVAGVCMVISLVIVVFISLHMSRQLTIPLQRLQDGFDRVEQGNLSVYLTLDKNGDLSALESRFNTMVSALKASRQELVQNQQELQEAQIRMMQAQLNPHFLGNTLDTMKWISKINRVPQVATMSTNLADILRFCISSEEFVPLYQELDILERYIEIQKIRLSDDFAYTTEVSEELYDCMIPKMILQPIVENAILHGLNGMEGSAIRISVKEISDTRFRITVTDNGRGFPPEMAGKPYQRDKYLAKGHLGLYNVHTILIRYYGEGSGLYLDNNEDGIGASVSACLPIHYEEEQIC